MPQTSGTPNPGVSTPPGAASTARLPEWPLVGRDVEFAVAREAIMSHGGVVLTGGAGVGLSPRQAVGIGLIVLGLVAVPRTVTRRQRTRMGRTWMALPP